MRKIRMFLYFFTHIEIYRCGITVEEDDPVLRDEYDRNNEETRQTYVNPELQLSVFILISLPRDS